MQRYSHVDVRKGALLVRRSAGPGWVEVARCHSSHTARALAEELNGLEAVHRSHILEVLGLLGDAQGSALEAVRQQLSILCEGLPEEGHRV